LNGLIEDIMIPEIKKVTISFAAIKKPASIEGSPAHHCFG